MAEVIEKEFEDFIEEEREQSVGDAQSVEKSDVVECFQLIAAVGEARSCYIKAVAESKKGNYNEAHALIEEGREAYSEGHKIHSSMLQRVAAGEEVLVDLLKVHAEDQLMSAEAFDFIAQELVELYEK